MTTKPSFIKQIHGGQVWMPDGFLSNQTLTLNGGKVTDIQPAGKSAPTGEGIINAIDGLVIPGLIDIQVNGALGWSFQAEHQAQFDAIIGYHLSHGTTSLLPTLVTAPAETLLSSLSVLAAYIARPKPVSLPGIHLEGPFLAPEKRGAHDESALLDPDIGLARQFEQAAQGHLKLLTLAPELPGALDLIEYFAEKKVIVSAGHSAASYADLHTAVETGLSLVTHAGNASDWPHRALGDLGFLTSEPGVVGAMMAEEALAGSIILDGYHFHPALFGPLVRLKGPEKIILVSDAAPVAGCPPGDYDSGGLRVTVHPEGFATSGRGGGWLAGSIITLLTAVQRAVTLAGVSLHQAVMMASLSPARLLKIADQKGQIGPGFDADLVILNQDLSLRHVIAQGVVNK
jgi:N-acetylglucosamine-6-phosphate deacetylase